MRLSGLLLTFALVASSTSFAAVDAGLLALVPPDAQVASGVHVDTSRVSPFGQFVLAHMQANSAQLQTIIDQTGFDPRNDVTEVLCASNGNQPQPSFLVLARGTFDPVKIQAAAVAKGATIQNYMGFDMILNQDQTHPGGVTFLGNTLAVAADLNTLQYAIAHSTDVSGGAPKVSTALVDEYQLREHGERCLVCLAGSRHELLPECGHQPGPKRHQPSRRTEPARRDPAIHPAIEWRSPLRRPDLG